jgi:hypothetical protein
MYRILNPKLLKVLLLDHQYFMFSSKFGPILTVPANPTHGRCSWPLFVSSDLTYHYGTLFYIFEFLLQIQKQEDRRQPYIADTRGGKGFENFGPPGVDQFEKDFPSDSKSRLLGGGENIC